MLEHGRTYYLKGEIPTVEYQDQSPDGLKLAIVTGALRVDQFSILQEESLRAADLTARCRIVGASHVIEYTLNGLPMWEVFACQDVEEDALRYSLDHVTAHVVETEHPGGARHIFQASLTSTEAAEEDLRRLRLRPLRLEFAFPSADGTQAPVTIISGEPQSGGILVETAHSYPNYGQVVLTRSVLQLRS